MFGDGIVDVGVGEDAVRIDVARVALAADDHDLAV
jgi:hypothetical protein